MQVMINGEYQTYDDEINIATLLQRSGLTGKRLAVEVNEHIIPKSLHTDTVIIDGDKVEIIQAIGGG